MPSHRMPRSLVAISGSAIAAIYMAGYLHTQAADETIAAAAVPTLAVAQSAPAVSTPVPTAAAPAVVQRQAPTAARAPAAQPTSAPTPASSSSTQTQVQYRDGTFTGQGTSRRGDVWVSVQVQGGRIANVTITRSTLQYPVTDIQGLPAQVLQRQSAQVDTVSRATYSSTAFRAAVTQALSAAQGA